MSKLYVNEIVEATAGAGVKMPAGNIVQSEFLYITSDITINTDNTWTDIPGYSFTISPKFSNSIILIEMFCQVYLGNNVSASTWASCNLRILRDSTVITAPDPQATDYFAGSYGGDDYRQMVYNMISYGDTPSTTNATTYKCQANFRHGWDANASIIINRYGRGMMKITEISQ